jgi:methyl-accepting chemotaxis protein
MDQVTQQNAALVEEAAAASESMQDQSQQLSRAVREFKLSSEPVLDLSARPAQAQHAAKPSVPAVGRKPAAGRQVAAPVSRSQLTGAPAASGGDWEEF